MESPQRSPPKRRSVPHIVEPTFRSLRASEFDKESYGAVNDLRIDVKDNVELERAMANSFHEKTPLRESYSGRTPLLHEKWGALQRGVSQIPAVALVTVFHLMVG